MGNEIEIFFSTIVKPAIEELKTKLEERGKIVSVSFGRDSASIVVDPDEYHRFDYRILVRAGTPYTEQRYKTEGRTHKADVNFKNSTSGYGVADLSKDEIIEHFNKSYGQHLNR